MAKKTAKVRRSTAKKSPSIGALASRVKALEMDFSAMRGDMNNLSEDVSALRTTVKRVDERSQRGEKLMLDMQGEQRKMSKVLDRIADSLKVGQGSEAEATQLAQEADDVEQLSDALDEEVTPDL